MRNKGDWVIYKDYDNVPPIICEDIWERVNEIIEGKKNTYIDKYKNKVYCKVHGKVISKRKKYKNKSYYYYICKDCFSISSRLLDRIVMKEDIKEIIVSNDSCLKLKIK